MRAGLPSAVTFDCWSTLLYEVDPRRSFERRVWAVAEAAAAAGCAAPEERARAALEGAWRRHVELWQQGVASGAPEIAGWALAELGVAGSAAAAELAQVLAGAASSAEVLALEGARETLERLAARGVRRALVCDTGMSPGRVVRQLLARAELLELLEVCVFSDEAGVPKPHPLVFHAALAPLRAEPGRAVHVGDLRRTDVAGARAVGMRAIRIRWHNDDLSAHPEADAVADSHAHLRELLGV